MGNKIAASLMSIRSRIDRFWEAQEYWSLVSSPIVIVILYLVNLILASGKLLPNLSGINPWDEASYVARGWWLLSEGLPKFGASPMMSFFYALTYLPFKGSPFWLVHSCTLGRFLLFSLLWFSTYLVARRLSAFAQPVIMMGFLFLTPMPIGMARYPSDPLFASMAALSLWQLLGFHQDQAIRHLWAASLFMGLAAMARNDGLVLFVIFVFLALILSRRSKRWWLALTASVIPCVALVGGYVLLYGVMTGDFSLGTVERTYDAFEAGQEVIVSASGELNVTIEAHLEARRIFGTPEENQYSVFRAIRRNPGVYFQRLQAALKLVPRQLWYVYGKRVSVVLFLLALWGIFELIKKKELQLLAVLCLWPAHLATGVIITLFRDGYLAFPFYIIFGLASIGLTAVLARFADWRERGFWTLLLLCLIVYGITGDKLQITYNALVFLTAPWMVYFAGKFIPKLRQAFVPLSLLVLFAGMFVLLVRTYPGLKIRTLGVEAKEQALLALMEQLEPGDVVAAGSPGVVWAAKMTYLGLSSMDVPVHRSPEDFLQWMINEKTKAIYVDKTLSEDNPAVWRLITPHIGTIIEPTFTGEGGDVQILKIRTNP